MAASGSYQYRNNFFNRPCEFLQAAFTVSSTDPISMSFSVDGAFTPIPIRISGSFFLCSSGTVGTTFYENFQERINNEFAIAGSGYSWHFIYSPLVGKWRIYTDAGQGNIDFFDVKAGISARVLGVNNGAGGQPGYDPNPTIGTAELTGSDVPFYVWRSSWKGKAQWKKPRETRAQWSDAIASNGKCYSFGKESGGEILTEWIYGLETEDKIRVEKANPREPFTWEHFVRHVGANKPFLVHTSSTIRDFNVFDASNFGGTEATWQNKEGVYRLTSEGAQFNYALSNPSNWQDYGNIPIKARLLGSGSQNGQH